MRGEQGSQILDVAVEIEEVAGPFLRRGTVRIGIVEVVLVGEQRPETAAVEIAYFFPASQVYSR